MPAQQNVLNQQAHKLRYERNRVASEIAYLQKALKVEIEAGVDEGDAEVTAQETYTALRTTLERRLHQLERALHAIEMGTYGICARCGHPIDPQRLEAKPEAEYCLACQTIVELARHATA